MDCGFRGPSDWIRTSGLLNPIQARYQTSSGGQAARTRGTKACKALIHLDFLHLYFTTSLPELQAQSREKAHRFFRSVRFLCALENEAGPVKTQLF